MTIDATFWVAISFLIFLGLLLYFKIPGKIKSILDEKINYIKDQVNDAEKLKDEARNLLSEHEKKISNSKSEIKKMLERANEEAERNIIKSNSDFHTLMDNRKKDADNRIEQMKNQAVKDIKNTSVEIAIKSVERLLIHLIKVSLISFTFQV